MNKGMNKEETQKLRSYLINIDEAVRDVSEVLDTSFMSDAKSTVYNLVKKLEALDIADSQIYADLLAMAQKARSELIGSGETWQRAGRSLGVLGDTERHLKSLLDEDGSKA